MFTPLDQRPPPSGAQDRRPHAAVIGSGLGGLAAAIRLGARGYRVTVPTRDRERAKELILLPTADVLTAVCEKAGCVDVLEQLREG